MVSLNPRNVGALYLYKNQYNSMYRREITSLTGMSNHLNINASFFYLYKGLNPGKAIGEIKKMLASYQSKKAAIA